MIVFAHLGHWYSAFGFLVPAALVIAWIRFQARRDRRSQEFAEHWTMELRDGRWTLASVAPAPLERRRRRGAATQRAASPWLSASVDADLATVANDGRLQPPRAAAAPGPDGSAP